MGRNDDRMMPFDTIASTYDATFSDTRTGRYQRAVVRGIMKRRFQPGTRVLEIGCGTGVDTLFLAKRGLRVVAIDASPAMAERTRQRVEEAGVRDGVEVRACGLERFVEDARDAPFDGLLSNFGVLNCVPHLDVVGSTVRGWLKPGGFAVLCLMGRWCAWEIIAHIAQRRFRTAFRRLDPGGTEVRVGDGFVHVAYPSPRRLVEVCRPYCAHAGTTGVGVLIPPSYLEPLAGRFPRIFQALRPVERGVNRLWPFNRLGDHYCVELRRTKRMPD